MNTASPPNKNDSTLTIQDRLPSNMIHLFKIPLLNTGNHKGTSHRSSMTTLCYILINIQESTTI